MASWTIPASGWPPIRPSAVSRASPAKNSRSKDRVVQVEGLDELGEVIGVGVQVVAVPRLAGTPAAAAVMRDGPVAVRGHEEQLVIPRVGGERPAVAEHDRAAAPGTRRTYQAFSRCQSCGQVYWRGAHSKRLEQIIDSAARAVSNATGK